jgi:hypothetical protein
VKVDLELRRDSIGLVWGGALPRDPWIQWSSASVFGLEPAPPVRELSLLSTLDSPASAVRLVWGELEADGVRLPRSSPIELRLPARGEIHVRDHGRREITIVSAARLERQEVEVVGGELWSRVPPGSYRLCVDASPVGPIISIAPGEVRRISLGRVMERSSLVLKMPRLLEAQLQDGVEPDNLLVTVSQASRSDSLLRQIAMEAEEPSLRIEDLPPGEVVVQLTSDAFGYSCVRAVLRPGVESVVDVPAWQSSRDVLLRALTLEGSALANTKFQAGLDGRGRSAVIRGVTDGNGEAVVRIAGGGRLTVGSPYGVAVCNLVPEASGATVRFSSGLGAGLTVRVAGWWGDKVQAVGTLSESGAGAVFVPGKASSVKGTYIVTPRSAPVIVVMLKDRSKILVARNANDEDLVLDKKPPSLVLSFERPLEQEVPQVVLLRVERVAGVSVSGTAFTHVLGRSCRFGEDLAVCQGAELLVVVEAAGSHGGILWRSLPTRLLPGAGRVSIPLIRIE